MKICFLFQKDWSVIQWSTELKQIIDPIIISKETDIKQNPFSETLLIIKISNLSSVVYGAIENRYYLWYIMTNLSFVSS